MQVSSPFDCTACMYRATFSGSLDMVQTIFPQTSEELHDGPRPTHPLQFYVELLHHLKLSCRYMLAHMSPSLLPFLMIAIALIVLQMVQFLHRLEELHYKL